MSKKKPNPARTLIRSLGGPTVVCELLGYDKKKGGVQRVANWQARGIPSAVLLERPDIFAQLRAFSGAQRKKAISAPLAAAEVSHG